MGAKAVSIGGNENSTVQKKAMSNTEVAQLASWKDTHELAASDPQFKKHKPIWTKVEDGTPNAVSTKEDQPPVVASSPEAVIAPQTEETTAEVAAVEETTAEVAPADATAAVAAPADATAAVAAPADATRFVTSAPTPLPPSLRIAPKIELTIALMIDHVKSGPSRPKAFANP